jgi:U2-associated protein SR140
MTGRFEAKLGVVFEHLHSVYVSFDGRIKADHFRRQVMAVTAVWETWMIFNNANVEAWVKTFLGRVEDEAPEEEGDVDGEPMEEEDVDGEPMDDDVDGEPMEDDVDAMPMDETSEPVPAREPSPARDSTSEHSLEQKPEDARPVKRQRMKAADMFAD